VSGRLRLDAKDIRFRFPGDSTWAAEIEGTDEPERWLRRFVETGLKIRPDEVIAQGPPWNTTLCVRGTTHLHTADGRVAAARSAVAPRACGATARRAGYCAGGSRTALTTWMTPLLAGTLVLVTSALLT